jgi:Fur family zinc uptake transcriptional regulator
MDPQAMNKLLQQAEQICQERGVRFTAQRRQVLEIVCAARRPLGAYEILDAMRKSSGRTAPPTVYRALEFLKAQGLIHKLESLHAFVGCNHPDHPHASQFLICSECGGIDELEDEQVSQSLRRASRASGFTPQRRIVELIGTCESCSRGQSDKRQ